MITASESYLSTYDFIIAGGGLAGLSLAYYLSQSSLGNAKILIIDQSEKKENDKTWCFWEAQPNAFDEIVRQKWNGVWFHGSRNFSQFLPIDEYQYKLIRSADFYQFIYDTISRKENINFLIDSVLSVEKDIDDKPQVKTVKGIYKASQIVFDSTFRSAYTDTQYSQMLQHFKGWVIETDEPSFDETKPTMFDFNVEQNDECRFVYVLPYSKTKALVEYTIFSDNLLEDSFYDNELKDYITNQLKIAHYRIEEVEKGVIPMSDEPCIQIPDHGIVRIGTSGGYVKASTGYSFTRTQRILKNLVRDLERAKGNFDSFEKEKKAWRKGTYIPNWKALLDSILLDVMLKNRHSSKDIFTCLFSKNRPAQILKFLDEDTSLLEDLAIMHTVPIIPFLKSAFVVIFRKIRLFSR